MKNRHYTVNSTAAAWSKAAEIFPTDYEKDEKASQNAGYPIYRSTAEGHYYDYICDLSDRLEVNLSTVSPVNIWIKSDAPQFKEVSKWDMEDIMHLCIERQFYTKGNIQEYSSMLAGVKAGNPTTESVQAIARDIKEHSDCEESVLDIMNAIRAKVIRTYYEIA